MGIGKGEEHIHRLPSAHRSQDGTPWVAGWLSRELCSSTQFIHKVAAKQRPAGRFPRGLCSVTEPKPNLPLPHCRLRGFGPSVLDPAPYLCADPSGGVAEGEDGHVLRPAQPVDGHLGAGGPLHHGDVVLPENTQTRNYCSCPRTPAAGHMPALDAGARGGGGPGMDQPRGSGVGFPDHVRSC